MHRHITFPLSVGLHSLFIWSTTFALQSERDLAPAAVARDQYGHPASKEWPMVGGDWSNSRYSAISQINKQSVERLSPAWISQKFDEGGTSRATPVVKDGILFVTAGRHIYALDAKTGARIWNYNSVPDGQRQDFTPTPEKGLELLNSPKGIPNGKGVGVGAGLLFVGLQDGHVIALRQKTGEFVWATQTGVDEPKKGQWASVAPTYSDGLVFSGLADGDHNQRGRLTALDAHTGRLVWQMFTVPGPSEPGHETWPSSNDTWRFGGGGVWTNPPVDPELGLVYFTAGNAVPAYAGDWRPGSNLYTCSVLAIEIKTGKLKWHYQLVHHDVFEADLGIPIVLYESQVDGYRRKALAVMRADGHLFNLDRETGQPILSVEERPVPQLASQKTSPTQPFPTAGESILMSCDDWKKERIPAGFALGCAFTAPAWPPPSSDPQNVLVPVPGAKGSLMAFSPQSGFFYAQGSSQLHWPRRSQDPYFLNVVGAIPGVKAYGELAAIDSRTGKIAWRKRMPANSLGGSPLVTAGGLMFRTSRDGRVEAYDAYTGDLLWQFQTESSGSGPPASYEINGEQYIAASIGPSIWAFKLGGTHPFAAPTSNSGPDENLSGALVEAEEIETTSLHRSLIQPGTRYFLDEFTFNPYRARVRAGTRVLFVNNGVLRHEIVAADNSWGTGPLSPTQEAWITFKTPGSYAYICKEHPWSHGQIVVAPADDLSATPEPRNHSAVASDSIEAQIKRGRMQFQKNCSGCHGDDLAGRAAAPALQGTAFISRWGGATVADLLENIRTTMPQAAAGTLERQIYLDIVAYLLKANNLIPDMKRLSDDPEVLKNTKVRTAR